MFLSQMVADGCPFVLFNALVKVPAGISDITCVAQVTLPVDETIESIAERAFENDWFNKEHDLNITKQALIEWDWASSE